MINYFLAYRPFQLDYSKKIISTYFENDINYIVNHFDSNHLKCNKDINYQIIVLPKNIISRIKSIKKIKNDLVRLAESGENVSIFIPHTLGILSNYVYFYLAKDFPNVKVNIFYEGVIVFYDYKHSYIENLGYYCSRKLISIISKIPYKIEKILLNLNDDRISKIYSPFINLNAPKEKIYLTEIEKVEYSPIDDVCIILGHKIDAKIGEQIKIISAIYNKIDTLNIKTVYIKDHPAEKCDTFYQVASSIGKELNLINNKLPIESIIASYCPKYVFSLWSSSIINLSQILPKDVIIFSFINEEFTKDSEFNKIISAFKDQNITVIYV